MLTHLDHMVLLTKDFKAAIADYEILLDRLPAIKATPDFDIANFSTGNAGLEIMAPKSDSINARTTEILGDDISRLTSLAFRCDDPLETHRLLKRRGAMPGDLSGTGSFRCADTVCAGVKTFILPPIEPSETSGLRLDHLVINTHNPDRAIAHYGARLGIRFALDRTIEQFQTRFLFFNMTGTNDPAADDEIWGLTWKTDDLASERERLLGRGVTVSEIRTGRKPGTQVFTVKSHSAGIPTLFLSHTKN